MKTLYTRVHASYKTKVLKEDKHGVIHEYGLSGPQGIHNPTWNYIGEYNGAIPENSYEYTDSSGQLVSFTDSSGQQHTLIDGVYVETPILT